MKEKLNIFENIPEEELDRIFEEVNKLPKVGPTVEEYLEYLEKLDGL